MNLRTKILEYKPSNEQEKTDKDLILKYIDLNNDFLYRTNLAAHMTSSAIIVNEAMTKVLFVYHNIYDSWSWVGGHNDGDPNTLEVAIKEAKEETGLKHLKVIDEDIFMLDVIYVFNHIKNDAYVPDHLHLNITYLLMADEREQLVIKPDENQGVKWFRMDEVFQVISEPRMIPIYEKAFKKIKTIKRDNR